MDEIDAALDYKNVEIVGRYIKERAKNSQFIVISLRNNMFELAEQVEGIFKTNDKTNVVELRPLNMNMKINDLRKVREMRRKHQEEEEKS